MLRTSMLGAVVAPGFESGVDLGEGDFGEEAEGAEIDAEDRGGGAGKGAGAASRVPSPPRTMTMLGRWSGMSARSMGGCVEVGGTVRIEKVLIAVCFEPRDEVAEDAGKFGLLRLGDDGGLEHGVQCKCISEWETDLFVSQEFVMKQWVCFIPRSWATVPVMVFPLIDSLRRISRCMLVGFDIDVPL